jgi:CheY-like chemotaxis protein/signal transduction histidine kinase
VAERSQNTVLVVEDNPGALKLFRLTLEAEGYRVLAASDGRTAIEHLTREPVGLVLQDLRLPDMDGTAVLHALRALPHGAGLPVVVVSGYKTLLEQLHCGPDGFTAALLKPVQPSMLVETVRRHMPAPAQGAPASSQGKTILVVDDDPVQLKLLRLRLSHEGFRVIAVSDQKQALAAATAQPPDAVLCDVLMPDTDGYELCMALRSSPALTQVPVVLASAHYGGARDEELARSVGAAALVTRTPDLETVVAALRTALARAPGAASIAPALPEHEHTERVIAQLQRQARANAGFAEKSALQAAQLSILAGIAEALLRSESIDAALDDVLTACLDAGGISRGAQYRVAADGEFVLTRSLGFPESAAEALASAFGCFVRLRQESAQTVFSARGCLDAGETSRLFAAARVAEAVLITFKDDQRCIGALLLGCDSQEMSEQDLLTFGRAIAAQMAQAAALAESFARLREGEQAGRVLNASLDLEQTLAALGRLATQRLSDLCEVQLGDAEARVYAGRHSEPDAAHLALLRALPVRSELVVPLVAQHHLLGRVTLKRVHSRLAFSQAEKSAAEDLVARATTAINNAILYKAANDASRMKDEFLATISHELRTPLTAILGWARMLTSGPADMRRDQAYRVIERNALAQARLIDDLLDTSRITSGHMHLDVERVNLARVIDATLESAKPALELKRLELRRRIPEPCPPVTGDPNRLQQVIWNLLSNAIKFTPAEGCVEIAVEQVAERVLLTVSDSGEGIDATFLGSVFDRFKQAESAITRTHGGLGLGLAIARHLVELHGGTVSARSAGKGQGSVFSVELPLALPGRYESQRPRAAQPRAVARSGALESVVVLVVDDDFDSRELIIAELQACGARVTTAASTAEALVNIAAHRPDIILSDIGMPGDDGYALIRRLRKLPSEEGGSIPAAAVTAYARAEDRAMALAAGFQLHVTKPIQPGTLMETVTALSKMRSGAPS